MTRPAPAFRPVAFRAPAFGRRGREAGRRRWPRSDPRQPQVDDG